MELAKPTDERTEVLAGRTQALDLIHWGTDKTAFVMWALLHLGYLDCKIAFMEVVTITDSIFFEPPVPSKGNGGGVVYAQSRLAMAALCKHSSNGALPSGYVYICWRGRKTCGHSTIICAHTTGGLATTNWPLETS